MKETKIQIDRNNKKTNVFIYNFLEEGSLLKKQEKFIENVTSKINHNEVGFAGWKDKKGFIEHLGYWLFFDSDKNRSYPKNSLSYEKINKLVGAIQNP